MKWPRDGLFVVRAIDGKYWAETISPEFLQMVDTATDAELYSLYILPVLQSLNDQIRTHNVLEKVLNEKVKAH